MNAIPKSWTVYTIDQRKSKINPQPQYQRAPVWNEAKKQKLIDSILRGYDIPKFYLRESNDSDFEHEVIDGQQRLRAIWDFLSNEYPLSEVSEDLPTWGDLSEKYHKDLPSDAHDKLGLFELSIVVIEKATELEVRDLFLRLQEGVSLNPAEKRNAMPGKMRDFIADNVTHKVFTYIHMSENAVKRFGRDDWLAHIIRLELTEGPSNVKASDLKRMYETHKSIDKATDTKLKRVVKNLNYLGKVFSDQPPELDIKWGFVDMYLLISKLTNEYDLKNQEKNFLNFYIDFENNRRSVEDIDDLARSSEFLKRRLAEYIHAFKNSGALKKNLETRNSVYTDWLHNYITDLQPLDSKRNFSHDERIIIFRKANEQCKKCHKRISIGDMHADHIVPHSKGGKTTIANAQALCSSCNLKKSNKT